MHINPNSGPAGHGHAHRIKAAETQPLDIVPTDDGGAVETVSAPPPSAASFSDPLTPETAFNTHLLGGEEQAEAEDDGVGEVSAGPGKSANSPAHIARQLIAEGLTGFAEGGKQPFGKIVSQVARGIVTLDGAREAAAAAATAAAAAAAAAAAEAEVPVEDGAEVPAGGDVAGGEIVVPQTTEPDEAALLAALDDGVATTEAPVPELDDDSLTEALLDILDGVPTDGETDTTKEEVV